MRGIRFRGLGFAALLAAAAFGVGCAPVWSSLRVAEREHAAREGLRLAAEGRCEAALPLIERAQASKELGRFGAESTWQKSTCLERLGRHEEAKAHRRLIHDFFSDSPAASRLPAEFRRALTELDAAPLRRPPVSVRLPDPRYSESAERSEVAGSVVVRYRLAPSGVSDIRVLETPHPLLASWAIEAVAAVEVERRDEALMREPFVSGALFRFQPRWGPRLPGGGSEEEGGEVPDDEPAGFEWFPDFGAAQGSPEPPAEPDSVDPANTLDVD